MPHKRVTKPVRATFTSKLSDPHDVYPGNSNHWSFMRVKGDYCVVQERQREHEKKGKLVGTLPPDPGCTRAPYVWSQEAAHKLRGHESFYDLVLQGLRGELPGDLSKDNHKNYNKSVIHWPTNPCRDEAKENYKYWAFNDLTTRLSRRPHLDRNKLPL